MYLNGIYFSLCSAPFKRPVQVLLPTLDIFLPFKLLLQTIGLAVDPDDRKRSGTPTRLLRPLVGNMPGRSLITHLLFQRRHVVKVGIWLRLDLGVRGRAERQNYPFLVTMDGLGGRLAKGASVCTRGAGDVDFRGAVGGDKANDRCRPPLKRDAFQPKNKPSLDGF